MDRYLKESLKVLIVYIFVLLVFHFIIGFIGILDRFSIVSDSLIALIVPIYLYNTFDNRNFIKKFSNYIVIFGVLLSFSSFVLVLMSFGFDSKFYTAISNIFGYLIRGEYILVGLMLLFLMFRYFQDNAMKAGLYCALGSTLVLLGYFTRVFDSFIEKMNLSHVTSGFHLFLIVAASFLIKAIFIIPTIYGIYLGEEGHLGE